MAKWAIELKKLGCQVSVVCPEGSNLGEDIKIIPIGLRESEETAYLKYKDKLTSGEFDAIFDNSWFWWSIISQQESDHQLPILHMYHSDPNNLGSPPPIQYPMIVSPSKAQADIITRKWAPVRVIPHGTDLDFYKFDPEVKRGNRYLFLARYTPEKGFREIAYLARKCKVGLDAYGDTEIIASRDYLNACMADCDQRQIVFHPGISRKETVKQYQSHKALITWLNYCEIFGLCVHPDTPIDTRKGTTSITQLEIGNEVISADGKYHPVLAKTCRPFYGDLIEITPSAITEPVQVTPEHRCWAMPRHTRNFLYAPEWIPASELQVGDVLLFPILQDGVTLPKMIEVPSYRRNTRNRQLPQEIAVSSDFWTLAGYYLAEGSLGAREYYSSFAFNGTEVECQKEILDLIDKLFNLKGHIRRRDGTKGIEVQAYAVPIAQILACFGRHSWEKHIPSEFWPLPDDAARSLLRAYFRGDGYLDEGGKENYPSYSITTVSPTLANQIKHLLLRLGFVPFQNRYLGRDGHVIKGKTVKSSRPYQRVGITGSQLEDFCNTVMRKPIYHRERQREIRERFIHNGILYLPIKRLSHIPFAGEVWDIQVKEQSSFESNGVLLHNTTVEAMACGTPVISKDSGAARELIKQGKTGFVVSTLEEAEELIKSDAVSKIDPQDCRRQAEEFSIQASATKYLKLFEEVKQGIYW